MTMAAKYDKTVISLEIGHDRFLIFENVEPETGFHHQADRFS
jgi:hypothetical protein